MSRLTESKLALKLRENKKAGIITGIIIAVAVISLVVLVVLKISWIKDRLGCGRCEADLLDCDFDLDFDDDDDDDDLEFV